MTATLWLFLWFLGPQSLSSSIQGVVVRAGTAQPLAGELVGLWPTTQTTRADAQGRFLFQGVAFGDYALTVVRDGIKLQVPVIIRSPQRIEGLTLELKSPPAISGTVFDPNGERVAGTHIQAFRIAHSPLGPRMRSVMSVVTDDLGEFRLFWLRPSEYYVSASLSDREQRLAMQGLRLSPNLSKPDAGFPTIFFGGGYSPSESQKVRLTRDTDSTGLQIFLQDGPRYTISGLLLPEPSCARVAIAQEGGFLRTDADSAPRVCGSFRVSGLSRGTYSILATNDLFASDIIRVSTVNPVTEVKVPMVKTIDISGRVTRDGVSGLLATMNALTGINVRLSRSSPDVSQEIETPVATDGSFLIPSVGPGAYDVSIQPLPERTYIRSINYRATDGIFTPIYIDGSFPGRLDIQMSQANATAEGVVVDRAGRPVPGAEVVLVPREVRSRRRADRYLATTTDAGGNFRVTGIPAVDYAVLAFEEIEPQAYFVFAYDFAAYTRYTTTAQTLSSGASNSPLRLIAIPASETTGGLR